MDKEEEYIELLTDHLESLNTRFEAALSSLANRALPEEVRILVIEYDSSAFGESFPVYMFAMNKSGDLVGEVDWMLKNEAVVVPAGICDSDKYEEIEKGSIASRVLESWLMRRWAGAGSHRYPTYLAHHDSFFMRNIETGVDTNWDEVMEKAES